ncbi:MAG: organomercurial lyase [Ilumatobacteraceae bacterium]
MPALRVTPSGVAGHRSSARRPGDAHFLVPTSRMWDDVIHTCSNQLLFCDDACIDAWLDRTGNEEGYRMDLATLWRFALGLVRRTARPRLRTT